MQQYNARYFPKYLIARENKEKNIFRPSEKLSHFSSTSNSQTNFHFRADKTQLLCRNAELMRKLRNLWSSHKKYCTTTITPFRSYTPLSGYPNSRSSYDLERTYYTSTPYTNRNRFRRDDLSSKFETPRDEIGDLSRNLSDLSIDRIGDSDDDPVKVIACNEFSDLS